jgi:hypothetical protein
MNQNPFGGVHSISSFLCGNKGVVSVIVEQSVELFILVGKNDNLTLLKRDDKSELRNLVHRTGICSPTTKAITKR